MSTFGCGNNFLNTCPLENAVMLKSKCPSGQYWFEWDPAVKNGLNRVAIMCYEFSGIQ